MAKFDLSESIKDRNELQYKQQKRIKELYETAAKETAKRAEELKIKGGSYAFQSVEIQKLSQELQDSLQAQSNSLYHIISSNIEDAAKAVGNDAKKFSEKAGLFIQGAYTHVPKDIVDSIVTGQVYKGDWSLSSALWKDIKDTQQDIVSIVAKGTAMNKSAYDIAKDLEKYVDPSARKDWEWSKVYPGTRKVIDYNAQRLARTMVSHAYQQSLERVCKDNPFVTGYIWRAAGTERTCQLCMDRDGQHFDKGELPLDHPNGMCTFLADVPSSMNQISDRLADWANGKSDPELDKWAESIAGANALEKKTTTSKQFEMTDEQKRYISKVTGVPTSELEAQGLIDEEAFKTAFGAGYNVWKADMKMDMTQAQIDALYKEAHDKGLTLKEYYEQYLAKANYKTIEKTIYTKKEYIKEVKVKVATFTGLQDKYLKKYGFTPESIPNYDDWFDAASWSDISKLNQDAKKAGMTAEEFYNAKLGKVKYKYEIQQISSAGKKIVESAAPEYTSWIDKIKQRTTDDSLNFEDANAALMGSEVLDAIRDYTGSDYEDINGFLRDVADGTRTLSEATRHYGRYIVDTANTITKGLSQVSFGDDVVLRRGTSLGEVAGFMFPELTHSKAKASLRDFLDNVGYSTEIRANALDSKLAGSTYTYSSYTSTSSIWEKGFPGEVEMIFYASKDTKGLSSIMKQSQFGTAEGETLLNSNMEIKIVKIEQSDGHKRSEYRVYAEILGVKK